MVLSQSLLRALCTCSRGKGPFLTEAKRSGMTFAILCGVLLERGLVREVKHRDHTRTYAPTPAGKVALADAERISFGEVSK